MKAAKRAVVLLSGGIDSSTTLALAASEGYECYALSFDYSQRHAVELEAIECYFIFYFFVSWFLFEWNYCYCLYS